jgi:hypothetical protein
MQSEINWRYFKLGEQARNPSSPLIVDWPAILDLFSKPNVIFLSSFWISSSVIDKSNYHGNRFFLIFIIYEAAIEL